MNAVRFCRQNRYAVYLLTTLLIIAGLAAIFALPSNIYPELNFPRIVILAHSGDLSPDVMLLSVTRPLEESVSTVFGFRRVRSKTIRGNSEISVLFRSDMDMQYALQLVQGRVSETRSTLPPDTELQVERISPAVFPVLSLILNGNVPDADLRDDAFYVLRPLFSRVPGVGLIQVQATDIREVSVVVDPPKLLAHRLSLVDARANALRSDWAAERPARPAFLGVRTLDDYSLAELVDYIDWTPFFSTWELTGKFPAILDDDKFGVAATDYNRRARLANEALRRGAVSLSQLREPESQ